MPSSIKPSSKLMQITEVFECHNKTVTRQSSLQGKSRRLSGKLHCLNFVFPAENETLDPVCLGCEASLSMLKVPNHEQFPTHMTQNNKRNKWLEIFFGKDFPPKLLWRTPTKIHCERSRRRQQEAAKQREHHLAQRRQPRQHSD